MKARNWHGNVKLLKICMNWSEYIEYNAFLLVILMTYMKRNEHEIIVIELPSLNLGKYWVSFEPGGHQQWSGQWGRTGQL